MNLNISFDETIYREQMSLLYDLAWKKQRLYYKNSHYFGFALSLCGIGILIESGRNFGYVFICFGLGILIAYYYVMYKSSSQWKKVLKEMERNIEILNQLPNTFFNISESGIKMINGEEEIYNSWESFQSYKIYEENLFLFRNDFQPFIFGKEEIGSEYFIELKNIAEAKIAN